MKFIPIQNNDVATLNRVIERLYTMIEGTSTKIETVSKQVEKVVTIETPTIVEETQETSFVAPVQTGLTMAGFTPIISSLPNMLGLKVDWASWPGYGNEDVSYYAIYASVEADCTISDENLRTTNLISSPEVLTDLASGVTYSIKIVAYGPTGAGAPSDNVTATVSGSTAIIQSGVDPVEIGDMRLVAGTNIVIDNCDTTTGWSLVSGGATFTTDMAILQEGTGSLRMRAVPFGATVVKKTFAPIDLSGASYIKLWLRRVGYVQPTVTLYFGETVYNERSTTVTLSTLNTWYYLSWDITAIPAAARNAVTQFGIEVTTTLMNRDIWIDDIRAVASETLRIMFSDGIKTVTVT